MIGETKSQDKTIPLLVFALEFREANMANPEHLAILKQGVKVWNGWRAMHISTCPDLSYTNLDGANLVKGYLPNTDLTGTSLRHANLAFATLAGSTLENTDLTSAIMTGAYLGGANLRKTKLIATLLDQTVLQEADFSESTMHLTKLADLDLATVIGLEEINHDGPSTIGIDTLYRSRGNIPDKFLRGCGVPETFITYISSLVGKPFEFYSCFISHSAKDKRFCERVHADLQANAVRVWYFPVDAKWGEPVWGEIDRSIKIYDKLIVVCSKNSLTSNPVLREIERALKREDKEDKNILFPIIIDNYLFDEWEHPRKADVLAKVVGTGFVGWNRSAEKYDKAFKKLLKALKAA